MLKDLNAIDIRQVDEVQAYLKDLNPMNWWEKEFFFRVIIQGEIHWIEYERRAEVEEFLKKFTGVNWSQMALAEQAEKDNEAGCFTLWKKT